MRFALAALLAGVATAPAATVPAVFDGRIPCAVRDGVQFCAGGLAARVETWDGVPLDVDVTLPPADMDGPFPLIVELHGWSGAKSAAPQVTRAQAGYVVLSYTARGFHASCGAVASRAADASLSDPGACLARGWTHLADARYEARDTQYLAGLLVDEGLVVPDRIGVTGVSYGGGQSMILAALRNRVMLPDGTLVPWKSPAGTDCTIAAAAPIVPWSDLAEALTPAGRTLDYRDANPYGRRAGVQKQSYLHLLYDSGAGTGFYAPPGADPSADLAGWNARIEAGEPYDGDSAIAAIIDEITAHHSAYYVDDSIPPAPLFIYNAWTDDLFPATEGLRFWRKTRALHPDAELALEFADGFGHFRANLGGNIARVFEHIDEFFARHLKGAGDPLPGVRVWTQGCNGVAEDGPFTADDWDALHPGEVRGTLAGPATFDQAGGDAAVATAVDPLNGGPCRTLPATPDPGAVTLALSAATGQGYTLLGSPTVVADVTVSGSWAQIAARLWDVGADGMQTLVSQALHRPRADNAGPQVFQLPANGWHFAAGHAPKLELLGQSAPFGRPSGGAFRVTVRDLELRLPVREAPDGAVVQAPAALAFPPAADDADDAGPPACGASPDPDCAAPQAGALSIRNAAKARRDVLVWKWKGRGPLLVDPHGTEAYRLCVYDLAGGLLGAVSAPAGGLCAAGKRTRECWNARRRGWDYGDPERTPDGLQALTYRANASGGVRLALAARGETLGLPAPPLPVPLRVQLRSSRGSCWDTTFAARVKRNTAGGRFQAAAP